MAVRRKTVTRKKGAAPKKTDAPKKAAARRSAASGRKAVTRKQVTSKSTAGGSFLGLHNLAPAPGSRRPPKRIGRGPGSGTGKTAGRGSKGQLSRSGYSRRRGFEGGQMPLHRRLPKRGFRSRNREDLDVVNLDRLGVFHKGDEVTPERMVEKGILKKTEPGVKVLGNGELKVPLRIRAHRFSKQALAKIEKAGGKAEVISR